MRIRNTAILDENFAVREGMDIQICEGRIEKIEPHDNTKHDMEMLDGYGYVFVPGMIDSHMHTGQQLLRGGVLDELPLIWTRIMLPFESTLTPEKMRLSAELAALEMMKAGTTGFVDAGSYFMEEAAEVYTAAGLRGALSYSTMDQPGLPKSIRDTAQSALERTDRLFDAYHGKGLLKVYYSLRALMSCSEELILGAAERAASRGTMLQAHMNEYAGEVNATVERKRRRPYEYLESLGVLCNRFLGAHSLLLSEQEMEILRERQVKICHCPFSNCGKAVPNTPALLKRGIVPGLGTDGTAHGGMSLWNEMKIFRSVMNVSRGVPLAEPRIMPARTILEMVWSGGAAALGEAEALGAVQEGRKADLIGIDLNQPHLLPSANLVNTLLESVNAGDVGHMIVNGKLLMKKREVLTLDEERILWAARAHQKSEGR